MDRDQKVAAIAEIADNIREAEAVYAVDYRGISVPQAAELRTRLRDVDATFRVVKNTLTQRAADAAGAEHLKELLVGPTALTFVRGDAALAAKAIADYGRQHDLLAFKGGLLDGDALDPEQIRSIARLPARDVLYGQLVGVVASPITGLARGLNALLSGVAVALGQILEKKESGELPAGEAPAPAEPAATSGAAAADEPPDAPAPAADEPATGAPTADAPESTEPVAEEPRPEDIPAETATEPAGDQDAEPPAPPPVPDQPTEGGEDASTPDNDTQANASAQADDAEATGGTT